MKIILNVMLVCFVVISCGCSHSVRDLQAPIGICKTKECFEQYLGRADYEGPDANNTVYAMSWYGYSGDRIFKVPTIGGGDFGTGYTEVASANTCKLVVNLDKIDGKLIGLALKGDCDPATKRVN